MAGSKFFSSISISLLLLQISNTFSVEILLKERLDVRGNNVGIHEEDRCYVIHPTFGIHAPHVAKEITVECKDSNKKFESVGFIVGSSTGTPPELMFNNVIGTKPYHSHLDEHKLEYNKRIILCNGPCELKEEQK